MNLLSNLMFSFILAILSILSQMNVSTLERLGVGNDLHRITRSHSSQEGNFSDQELSFFFDWKKILEPCWDKISWQSSAEHKAAASRRTNAKYTKLIAKKLKLDGSISAVSVQTYAMDGKKKQEGGDSWRATLKGTSSQMAIVQDNIDGTYEILFRIYENGWYELEMMLEYSMCDGLRDPPMGWFESGDMQGHFQHSSHLGNNSDRILEKVTFVSFEIKNVETRRTNRKHEWGKVDHENGGLVGGDSLCKLRNGACQTVWDSFGSWKHVNGVYTWISKHNEGHSKWAKRKLHALWIYGDSISQRWWQSKFRRSICEQVFEYCRHTYTFTYENRDYNVSRINFGLPFNKTRFLDPIKKVLGNPRMKDDRSVFVINFGIHLILSLNFTDLKETVEKFAELIQDLRRRPGFTLPRIIWRTTTSTFPEARHLQNTPSARFLTNHRIQLFNAYANSRFCSIGIAIFDVYTVTSSYPPGCRDGVHFTAAVFKQANNEFGNYLQNCIY